jgi:(2Fe-2S) ferredoxin
MRGTVCADRVEGEPILGFCAKHDTCSLMSDKLQEGLKKAAMAKAERHLFLCLGPDCCEPAEGEKTWEYIKLRVRETGIRAMRTKAACFRICTHGPWLAIYPEGIWYSQVTPERFEQILQRHLLGGEPIVEWIAARSAFGTGECGGSVGEKANQEK